VDAIQAREDDQVLFLAKNVCKFKVHKKNCKIVLRLIFLPLTRLSFFSENHFETRLLNNQCDLKFNFCFQVQSVDYC
jgi:hypothetical protein